MLVVIPVFLEMCQCGEHGSFVFPDGTRSEEFCSKESFMNGLYRLKVEVKVSEHEFEFLKNVISDNKTLPPSDWESDPMVWVSCLFESKIREIEKE